MQAARAPHLVGSATSRLLPKGDAHSHQPKQQVLGDGAPRGAPRALLAQGEDDKRHVSIVCNLLKNISWHILSRRETPYVIYIYIY